VVKIAGGGVQAIVSVTIYLVDTQDYQAMNDVRRGALVESSAVALIR
jgi:enamine deaminase RidA (YjgF/YER057c/UK114 family)